MISILENGAWHYATDVAVLKNYINNNWSDSYLYIKFPIACSTIAANK